MDLGRRAVVKLMASAAFLVAGFGKLRRGLAGSAALGVHSVTADDAPALQAIMQSCVGSADAFYGKCGEWSLSWAQAFVQRNPSSPVITMDGVAVAFFEVPPIRPPVAPLTAGDTGTEKQAMRDRNCTTFQVTAAGVRYDLLSSEDAVRMFWTLLYAAFETAQQLGYQYVEAWAPWEQHPLIGRKWTDYPGCELIGVARNQETGGDSYWLRWHLADALTALHQEERFDVG